MHLFESEPIIHPLPEIILSRFPVGSTIEYFTTGFDIYNPNHYIRWIYDERIFPESMIKSVQLDLKGFTSDHGWHLLTGSSMSIDLATGDYANLSVSLDVIAQSDSKHTAVTENILYSLNGNGQKHFAIGNPLERTVDELQEELKQFDLPFIFAEELPAQIDVMATSAQLYDAFYNEPASFTPPQLVNV